MKKTLILLILLIAASSAYVESAVSEERQLVNWEKCYVTNIYLYNYQGRSYTAEISKDPQGREVMGIVNLMPPGIKGGTMEDFEFQGVYKISSDPYDNGYTIHIIIENNVATIYNTPNTPSSSNSRHFVTDLKTGVMEYYRIYTPTETYKPGDDDYVRLMIMQIDTLYTAMGGTYTAPTQEETAQLRVLKDILEGFLEPNINNNWRYEAAQDLLRDACTSGAQVTVMGYVADTPPAGYIKIEPLIVSIYRPTLSEKIANTTDKILKGLEDIKRMIYSVFAVVRKILIK